MPDNAKKMPNFANMKYYELIENGYDKNAGMLFAPADWPCPIAVDAVEVENWQNLVLELRNGIYCPFLSCNAVANMVSEELKNLFLSFIGENEDIEFLPVPVISKEYGDRTYYIMHFKVIYDVIDKEKTVYVPGTDIITKVRIDQDKAKGLKVFNSQPAINDVIVSEDVYQSMKKNKFDRGLEFRQVGF